MQERNQNLSALSVFGCLMQTPFRTSNSAVLLASAFGMRYNCVSCKQFRSTRLELSRQEGNVMSVKITVGRDHFDSLIQNGSYYVDKTELLYELVEKTDTQVTLFTRPRRFGKTLMMSMMESFFDIRRDSRNVFEGLDIAKHEAFCARWMNQYPTLFVSFKDVEGFTFDEAYRKLRLEIADLCKKHSYLESSDRVDAGDVELFQKLRYITAEPEVIQYSLKTLSRMMSAHYGKPVILLIDEYDVPLAKANEQKEGGQRYYPQMLDVMRGMMSTALKSNESLKFGVVTGCLRISKESIFTGVNNFATFSVLDDRFSQYFGFTQEEVDALLKAADLESKTPVFKEWYDGYLFGDHAVYCPWDVMNYTADLQYKPTSKPKNYWKNTSGNGILREFVSRTDLDVSEKFETLMNGGTILERVSDSLTYDSLHESEENLWSVLLMTGYLTKADPTAQGETVALRIPNQEILSIFEDTVVRLFTDTLDRSRQQELMNALWSGDETAASELLSDFLWETISFHDYHENYYHAFLGGIFVGLGYAVQSNQEQGLGRSDLAIRDKKNRRALIIEAKRSVQEDKMEQDCQEALKQIVDRQYAKGLRGYRTIQCYGVAFYQKSALVKKL